jgi:hypothetical protein
MQKTVPGVFYPKGIFQMPSSALKSQALASELLDFARAEEKLVRAAALHIMAEQKQKLTALGALLMQCARVGDIERNLSTDREIEQLVGVAAGMPEEAAAQAVNTTAFKQAWKSCNALRDAVPFVQMRVDQIKSIVSGDADGSAALTHAFFASAAKAI